MKQILIKVGKMKNKLHIIAIIMFLIFLIISGTVYVSKERNIKANKSLNIAQIIIKKEATKTENHSNSYMVNLSEFQIKNDGTSPIETSSGINKALQYAEKRVW